MTRFRTKQPRRAQNCMVLWPDQSDHVSQMLGTWVRPKLAMVGQGSSGAFQAAKVAIRVWQCVDFFSVVYDIKPSINFLHRKEQFDVSDFFNKFESVYVSCSKIKYINFLSSHNLGLRSYSKYNGLFAVSCRSTRHSATIMSHSKNWIELEKIRFSLPERSNTQTFYLF